MIAQGFPHMPPHRLMRCSCLAPSTIRCLFPSVYGADYGERARSTLLAHCQTLTVEIEPLGDSPLTTGAGVNTAVSRSCWPERSTLTSTLSPMLARLKKETVSSFALHMLCYRQSEQRAGPIWQCPGPQTGVHPRSGHT